MIFALPFPWKIAAALAAVVFMGALFGAGYVKGKWTAESACEADALKAQLAETERQRQAGEEALAHATELFDQQNREIAGLEAEAEAYVHMLEEQAPDAGACLLSDDDARRLRLIK